MIKFGKWPSFLHEARFIYSDPKIFDEPLIPDDTEEEVMDGPFIPPRQKIFVARAERTISNDKYKELKPCFLYWSKDIVEQTLRATTQ